MKNLSKIFLVVLIVLVLFACYFLFKPFLVEILAAAILATIFYKPYLKLVKFFKGKKKTASLVMCILIVLLVVIPLINFFVYAGQKSIVAYTDTVRYLNRVDFDNLAESRFFQKLDYVGINRGTIKGVIAEMARKSSNVLVDGATSFVKGTTNFIFSMSLIIFGMFFFFVDGEKMLLKLMHLTPLENKYDRAIFKKFKDVSYSTIISTFVVAIVQAVLAAIGFFVIGMSVFLPAVLTAVLSLLPYVGAALVWFPVGIYLLITGQIWQGVFILAWGGIIVSNIDNIIRAYLIKGKANVHPLFILFSIFGGIAMFGFWGIFLGPLIIAITVTIFHLYELEFGNLLEK